MKNVHSASTGLKLRLAPNLAKSEFCGTKFEFHLVFFSPQIHVVQETRILLISHNFDTIEIDICKVRKTQHQISIPCLVIKQVRFLKPNEKCALSFNRIKTQISTKFEFHLVFFSPWFLVIPSTNHCWCYVYCSYKYFGTSCMHLILIFNCLYPYSIKFHYFADNNGFKGWKRG
jgi:hypothetical protein